jgi:flagellar protein FliJ
MRSRDSSLRLHRFKTEEKRRQLADIESMIADFMRKYDDLDQQIKVEEQKTGVTDPNHFNYSMAAKAVRGRRDNLLKSINDLKEQLSGAKGDLAVEEAELRKIELLVEKEGSANVAPVVANMHPAHAR